MADARTVRPAAAARALHGPRALGLAVASAVLALDQAAKWLVLNPLSLEERSSSGAGIEILPFFRFIYSENPGISMRFLPAEGPAMRWLLVALTAAIAAFLLGWLWRSRTRGEALALALVIGGAMGNILDRARLGHVVDFADLHFGDIHPFLVFNVADAAITMGVLLLLARALFAAPAAAQSRERGAGRPDEVVNG